MDHAKSWTQTCVVAWRTEIAFTHGDYNILKSTHEEADTKIILHALNVRDRGAIELLVISQDTDVMVLMVRRYPKLPSRPFFVPRSGEYISIRSIYQSLGELKSSALSGFHAFSGCDTTECLNGKGKLSYWKAFMAATDEQLVAYTQLGKDPAITSDIVDKIE